MDRSTELVRQTAVFRVFFEEPFWVGVFERIREGRVSVFKVTFGAEPKDYEVLAFLLENYDKLRFGPSVETMVKETDPIPNGCSGWPKGSFGSRASGQNPSRH